MSFAVLTSRVIAINCPRMSRVSPRLPSKFQMKNQPSPLSRNLLGIAALALAVQSVCVDAAAADWPRWRGPSLNGISTETGWKSNWGSTPPTQLWKASVGIGFASFSVADGRVYTAGNAADQDTVFCFDAASGKELWKHTYAHPLDPKYYEGGPSATPTVDAGRVYHLSKRGHLMCLDAAKGTIVWTKELAKEVGAKMPEWGFAGSPLVEGDRLIVSVGAAGTAVEKATGKVIWTSGKDAAGYATPVPFDSAGERLVAILCAKTLVAVRVSDGKEVWSQAWKTSYDVNAADPVISGNAFFISSGYNRGCGLVKVVDNKPSVVYDNKNMRNHFNSCVLKDGFLYGVDEDQLRCLSLETGEVKWTYKEFGKGSLVMVDNKLVALSEKGELIIAEPTATEFKAISRAQILGGKCWTAPVLSNGRLYARNAKGDVVCVDLKG